MHKGIPLTKYSIQGRQGCCGNPNGRDPNTWYIFGQGTGGIWNVIDYQSNVSFNWQPKTFNINNPKPYTAYMILVTVAGDSKSPNSTRTCVQISEWKLYTSSNYTTTSTKSAMINIGKMSFEQCESYAINTANKYFGIQDVDNNGIGNCMISNDLAGSQQYGISNIYNSIPIWSSNTQNQSGTMANLTNAGSLAVMNSGGQAIFATPNKGDPSNYLGCYGDSGDRAMPLVNGGSQSYNLSKCQNIAKEKKANYFGLQNSTSGSNAQCGISNDLKQTTKYGKAGNCTKISDGSWSGGGWSNAVYSTGLISSSYFIVLQDDGNMVLYRGSGPSNNQGIIWSSGTNGKQKNPNPNFAASKGKNGQNWFSSGFTLASNEFIGSNDGSIYLIMQSDGNLVLYTSTQKSSCSSSKNSNGKTVGSQNVNALYQIKNIGNKNNMGKVGYIDENTELHLYPTNNIQFSNYYTKIGASNNLGNNIQNASYSNTTIESCKTTCNNNSNCSGFVFDNINKVCYPKNANIYPSSDIQIDNNTDLYVRNKTPINPPIGASYTTNNIDSVTYQNYINGGELAKEYGLANASQLQKQQLEHLQTKMNLISSQIANLNTKFGSGAFLSENQQKKNLRGLDNYLTNLNEVKHKMSGFSSNTDNILDDSDIVVLQKNYDYLFWSILAAGTVLVSMNIVKK